MLKKLTALCLPLMYATSAHAIIIGGAVTDISGKTSDDAYDLGGTFQELTLPFDPPNGAPNTVGNDTFQNNNLYAFNEGQNIEVTNPLNVNIGSTIDVGTIIASHYVFFDPEASIWQKGYVDFDADILAVITSTSLLADSDYLLNNNVDYLNPGNRGLESNTDNVSIGGTGEENRLYVNWRASTPGDYVRVITAFSSGGTDPCTTNPPGVGGCPAVPEPPLYSLLLAGIAGIGIARKIRLRR